MKMNKKGFTLIELLAVLAIIAILTVVIFPDFLSIKNDQQIKFSNSLNTIITSAAKVYVANNSEYVNGKIDEEGGKHCVAIGTLKAYDYVSIPTYNPVTNEKIDLSTCVYISKLEDNSKIKYKYEISKTDKKSGDYIPPIITLKEINGTKEGTCKSTMVLKSKEDFNNMCSVVVSDNVDNNINVDEPIESVGADNSMGKSYILKYNAKDSSGNMAKQLIVKLIISE